MMTTKTIVEYVQGIPSHLNIDRNHGIVRDVKILGINSKNGRVYPENTLKESLDLYENAKVNLNHTEPNTSPCRKYQDRFGFIKNIKFKSNDGLFADFYFNPKHVMAEQFMWDAEHRPENLGMSHNVSAVVVTENNKQVVKKIVAVHSVDLVADPATTNSLFESLTDSCTNETFSTSFATPSLTENKNSAEENNSSKTDKKNSSLIESILFKILDENVIDIKNIFSSKFMECLLKINQYELSMELLEERISFMKKSKSTKHPIISEQVKSLPVVNFDKASSCSEFIRMIKQ